MAREFGEAPILTVSINLNPMLYELGLNVADAIEDILKTQRITNSDHCRLSPMCTQIWITKRLAASGF